jgi:phage terminase small subunit
LKVKNSNRQKAYELWRDNILNNKGKRLKDIAEEVGEKDSKIRKWKCEDNWQGKLVNENPNAKQHPEKSRYGNKNSIGNKGGPPKGSQNNLKYGFFSKILPEDALAIANEIDIKKPIDILWENIVLQYLAIARAQKIMYVESHDDITREPKRSRVLGNEVVKEYEVQFPWDKQSNFLQSQSRAMATLQNMISKYEELLNSEVVNESERLKVEKLKVEVAILKG